MWKKYNLYLLYIMIRDSVRFFTLYNKKIFPQICPSKPEVEFFRDTASKRKNQSL